VLLAAPWVLAGCTSSTTYAAMVNGAEISRSSLNQELSEISHNHLFVQAVDQQAGSSGSIEGVSAGSYSKAFVAQVLTQRIEYELIHQELARRNALPGESELQQAEPQVVQRYTLQDPGDVYRQFSSSYQRTLVQRQAEVTALENAVPGQQAVNDLFAKLIGDASIKVSPEFGSFDKKGNPSNGTGPSVIPPPVPNPPIGG
jgi:inactivated superfamily I helicase